MGYAGPGQCSGLSLRAIAVHSACSSLRLCGVLGLLAPCFRQLKFLQFRLGSLHASVALLALVVCTGLVAPRLEFSPVMRRRVEILEIIAIGLVFPLACWIIRCASAGIEHTTTRRPAVCAK